MQADKNNTFQPLLDAEKAAAMLGCHPRTLMRKAREGIVPCVRIFGRVRFTESALADWVAAQEANRQLAA